METVYRNHNTRAGASLEKGMQAYRRSVAWAGRQLHCATPVLAVLATRWFQATLVAIAILLLYSGCQFLVHFRDNVGVFQGDVFRLVPSEMPPHAGGGARSVASINTRDVATLQLLLNGCSVDASVVRALPDSDGATIFFLAKAVKANGWSMVNGPGSSAGSAVMSPPHKFVLQVASTAGLLDGQMVDVSAVGDAADGNMGPGTNSSSSSSSSANNTNSNNTATVTAWSNVGSSSFTWSRDGRHVVLLDGARDVSRVPFGETVMDMRLPWPIMVSTGVSCICSGSTLALAGFFAATRKESRARFLFFVSFFLFSLCNAVAAVAHVVDGKRRESFMCFAWALACAVYPAALLVYERLFADLSLAVSVLLMSGACRLFQSVSLCMLRVPVCVSVWLCVFIFA